MITKTSYICGFCGAEYNLEIDAVTCENQPIKNKPNMEIGKKYENIYYPGRQEILLDLFYASTSPGEHEWIGHFTGMIKDSDHYDEGNFLFTEILNGGENWREVA